jgi:cupin
MTLGFIGPCGINTPHVHPRSSQINVVVKNKLATEFTLENGARSIVNTLDEFEMTVFPQGAVHTEWNPTCEESIFVAGFASEDPGVQQSAQTFFGLQDNVIDATLGVDPNATFNGEDLDSFKHMIPDNVAQSIELCLKSCSIKKKAKRSLSEI